MACWFAQSTCFHNRVVKLHLRSTDKPFFIRFGTSDCDVLAQIFFGGEYDFLQSSSISSVETVVDLGANVGFFSRWISAICPSALLIGVEPDDGNMTMLRMNVQAGGMNDRYVSHQACVAATNRKVQLNRSQGEWAFSMIETATAKADSVSENIDTVTVSEIIGMLPGRKYIDLLKCDIEGSEIELFKNCSSWIDKVGSIVIETHPPYSPEEMQKDLASNGANFLISAKLDVGSGMYVLLLTRAE